MLKHLEILDLSNQIQGLTGTIPNKVSLLTHLTKLHLSGNKLSGTIPFDLGYLTKLRELDISSNELTGTIPTEIGRLKGKFRHCILYGC